VSDAAHRQDVTHGTVLLPPDLDAAQLAPAPDLESIDVLLIGELTLDEDDAFQAAISS